MAPNPRSTGPAQDSSPFRGFWFFRTNCLINDVDDELKKLPHSSEALTRLLETAFKALRNLKVQSGQPVLSEFGESIKLFSSNRSTSVPGLRFGWRAGGWNPTAFDIGIDRKIAHTGRASGYISKRGGFSRDITIRMPDWATLVQTVRADDFTGRRVRLSAFIRVDGFAKLRDAAGWIRRHRRAASGPVLRTQSCSGILLHLLLRGKIWRDWERMGTGIQRTGCFYELRHLVLAENQRQSPFFLRERDVLQHVCPLQCFHKQETKRCDMLSHSSGRQSPITKQVRLVGADLVWSEFFDGPSEIAGELVDDL
jgi:hypothetical protein